MEFNFLTHLKTCSDFIQFSNPVSLILYTHIPSAIIALFVGFFVFIRNKSLEGKILFAITISFFLWTLIDLIVWLSNNSILIMFSWAFFGLLTSLISILFIYFFFVFLYKKNLSFIQKILLFSPLLPVLIFTPTDLNLTFFDVVSCEAIDNINFVTYYYCIGGIAMLVIFLISILSNKGSYNVSRKEKILMTSGIELFLASFLSLGYISSYFDNYTIEFYGLLGMVVFISFLSYLIVKFKTFNLKIFGAQVLIFALIALVGSEFFFITSNTNRILTAITLVITGFIGINLMRSVKKEIDQREKIESLAVKLEKTNESLANANEKLKELDQLKSEFVSLATHQIRAPLSAIKGYISEIFEGDFGPLSPEIEKPLQIVFQSTDNLVHIVGDFLNISRIEQGKMKYELSPFDLRQVAEDTIKSLKPNLEKAGLKLIKKIPESGNFEVYADIGKVREVISNLIDNSIKYTPRGSITISLEEKANIVQFRISDTGIGIDPAVMPKLFQKFTRAKNANEVNIIGTGLGLYVARLMIEGQRGKIWAESEGNGKGSSFIIELPVAHVS